MVFGIPALYFTIILLLACVAGMLGAVTVLLIVRVRLKHNKKIAAELNLFDRSNWDRMSRDEQLYNGR